MIIDLYDDHCKTYDAPWQELKDFLTVEADNFWMAKAYKEGKWDGTINYYKQYKFPSGFLPMVQKHFDCTIRDMRELLPYNVDDIPEGLREYQLKVVLDALNARRGIVKAATNAGKSYMMYALYHVLNCRTAIFIHRTQIAEQLYELFTSMGVDVGYVGNLFKKRKIEFKHVTIIMQPTLAKNLNNFDVQTELSSLQMIMVDESHRQASKTYKQCLIYANPHFRYSFSGTPLDGLSAVQKMDIIGWSGPPISNITNKQLIDSGFSQKPTIYLKKCKEQLFGLDYRAERSEMWHSEERLKYLLDNVAPGSLVVCQHKEHMEHLVKGLLPTNLIVDFSHGEDPNRAEKFEWLNQGSIDVLVTTMIVKEGLNMPSLRELFFMAGGKSPITVNQVVGRLLRHDGQHDECKVHDFIDCGPSTYKHSLERKSFYKKEGYKIVVI